MPVVPYEPGRIQNSPLPGSFSPANATAESFGGAQAEQLGQVGNALQRSGGIIGQIGVDEQEKVNTSLVRDAVNQYRFKSNDYASNSVYTKKGRETFGIEQSASTDLSKMSDELKNSLQTDVQKKMFDSEAAAIKFGHLNDFQRYAVKERTQFDDQTKLAENLGFQQDAVSHRYDPALVNHSEQNIIANIANLNNGAPSAVVHQEIAKAVDSLHSDVLDSIGHDSPVKALAYLSQNKDKFLPDRFDNLKHAYEDQASSEIANHKAQILSQTYSNVVDAQADVDRSGLDAKTAELAMSMFKTRRKDAETAATQAQWDITEKRWNEVLANPNAQISNDPSIPSSERIKMNETRNAYLDRLARPLPSDKDIYADLLHKTTTGEIVNENILSYAGKLDPHDITMFQQYQKDLRGGDSKMAERIRSLEQQANNSIEGMAVFGTNKSRQSTPAQATEYNHFITDLSTRVNQLPKEQQDEKNVQGIIDDMLKPVPTDTRLFGLRSPATTFKYQLSRDPSLQKLVPDPLRAVPGVEYNADRDSWLQRQPNGTINIYDNKGVLRQQAVPKTPAAKALPTNPVTAPVSWNFSPSPTPVTDLDTLTRGLQGGLKQYSQNFIDSGVKNGVDPALLGAIAMFETGRGTSDALRNKMNAMGVSDDSGPISFAASGGVAASIERMAQRIASSPVYEQARRQGTIESLARIYSPPGASNDPRGTNGEWPQSVKKFYNDLRNS